MTSPRCSTELIEICDKAGRIIDSGDSSRRHGLRLKHTRKVEQALSKIQMLSNDFSNSRAIQDVVAFQDMSRP